MTEHASVHWSLVVVLGALAVAWVTVEWLKRRCWHTWKQTGQNEVFINWHGSQHRTGWDYTLTCKHCGDIKVVKHR